MEKEGLKRNLDFLDARGVTVECITTDRHLQIQKFLRERNVLKCNLAVIHVISQV